MGVYEKTNTFLNHQTVWLQPSAQMWPVPWKTDLIWKWQTPDIQRIIKCSSFQHKKFSFSGASNSRSISQVQTIQRVLQVAYKLWYDGEYQEPTPQSKTLNQNRRIGQSQITSELYIPPLLASPHWLLSCKSTLKFMSHPIHHLVWLAEPKPRTKCTQFLLICSEKSVDTARKMDLHFLCHRKSCTRMLSLWL